MPRYINVEDALQAHPEFLNEQIDDHDKSIYAKGWNACNSAFYGAIKELPAVSPDEVRGVGKWISNHDGSWRCSECGLRVRIYAKGNYCQLCGARMGGVQDALS